MSLDDNQDIAMNPAPPPTDEEQEAARTQQTTDAVAQQERDAAVEAQRQRDLAAKNKHDTDAATQQQRAADVAALRKWDADAAAAAQVITDAAAAQALAAQQLATQQAAAFVMPTTAALMAHIPPSRARNLSLLYQTAQPAPPVDADLGRARFQHNNNGQFCKHVVTNDAMTRGIAPSQLEDFLGSLGTKIILPIVCGGWQFFQVNFETPVDDQVKMALRMLAPTSEINVRIPVPANQYTSGTAKYGGPHSILVDIGDAAKTVAVVANKTYAIHEALAFWAHDYHANAATRNWVFGHYDSIVNVPANIPN
jgi:hypothetical protein